MTKKVRVENADNNLSCKVVVETWDKGRDGAPDTLALSQILLNPTDLQDFGITSTRYLVVKEEVK